MQSCPAASSSTDASRLQFSTLLAANTNINALFALWDFYVLESDPLLHHFVCIAFMVHNRRNIFAFDASMLLETLPSLAMYACPPCVEQQPW